MDAVGKTEDEVEEVSRGRQRFTSASLSPELDVHRIDGESSLSRWRLPTSSSCSQFIVDLHEPVKNAA